eukprot:328013-Rhodomonas_salina.1
MVPRRHSTRRLGGSSHGYCCHSLLCHTWPHVPLLSAPGTPPISARYLSCQRQVPLLSVPGATGCHT